MEKFERKIAKSLLQINAIKFNPANPFLWSSGWKSPIYCDNRKILSFPSIRDEVRKNFVKSIEKNYKQPDVIAGVATGAIALGALTADAMELPFVYVRSSAKKHGLENKVEGVIKPGQSVVVIEDLVSTGRSSLNAVQALREAGGKVTGMGAIFSYGFSHAQENFKKNDCPLFTLTNYSTLIKVAIEEGFLDEKYTQTLQEWRKEPETWGQK